MPMTRDAWIAWAQTQPYLGQWYAGPEVTVQDVLGWLQDACAAQNVLARLLDD